MPARHNPPGPVLVIDDDPVMRELLCLLLQTEGYHVRSAAGGAAAMADLERQQPAEHPELVLCDLRMPGSAPNELAARLRAKCPDALLLAMSGSDPAAGDTEGFDGFVQKPFAMAELESALRRAQAGPGGRSGSPRTMADHPPQTAPVNEPIYAKLAAMMGATQLSRLYRMLLDDAPARADRMRSAAAKGDAATFIGEAHAIKGSCGMLGATEIQSLAERMERGGLACSSLLQDLSAAFERLRRMLDERMNGYVE